MNNEKSNPVYNISYPASAAAVVFGAYLSVQAAYRLDRKSPAIGNFSYRETFPLGVECRNDKPKSKNKS